VDPETGLSMNTNKHVDMTAATVVAFRLATRAFILLGANPDLRSRYANINETKTSDTTRKVEISEGFAASEGQNQIGVTITCEMVTDGKGDWTLVGGKNGEIRVTLKHAGFQDTFVVGYNSQGVLAYFEPHPESPEARKINYHRQFIK
jgi:hypothetical protein